MGDWKELQQDTMDLLLAERAKVRSLESRLAEVEEAAREVVRQMPVCEMDGCDLPHCEAMRRLAATLSPTPTKGGG